jgi:hypothetical protein
MCTNEGCSICPCEADEIPEALLQNNNLKTLHREGISDDHEYGWVSKAGIHGEKGGKAHSSRLGKVDDSTDHAQQTHVSESGECTYAYIFDLFACVV